MVGKNANRRVGEEHRDKAWNNQNRGADADQNADGNQLTDGAPHKAPDHRIRREAIDSGAVDRQHRPGDQTLRDTVEGFGQLGDKHPHALSDDENRHREGETGLQDIDRPVGFTRHRLHHVNAEREQDRTEEDSHHNRGGNDVVVEDVQPAGQLEVFDALLFFPQPGRHFVGNPRGELLLVPDRKTAAVGDQLSRLVHHIGGNAPVE